MILNQLRLFFPDIPKDISQRAADDPTANYCGVSSSLSSGDRHDEACPVFSSFFLVACMLDVVAVKEASDSLKCHHTRQLTLLRDTSEMKGKGTQLEKEASSST